MEIGHLYALAAFFLIGSYLVPARFSRVRGSDFLPFMAMGLLILEGAMVPQLKRLWGHPDWLAASILSGFLWVLGQGLANAALEEISLAKASVFFNVNSFLNIGIGLVVFHEASGLRAYCLLISGGILLFAGAWIVARVSAVPAKERNLKRGTLLSLLAGLFWGIYFVPIQRIQSGGAGSELSSLAVSGMILGGALPAFLWGLRKGRKFWNGRDSGLGFLTALFWVGGTLCFLKANQALGLARAVPIVNANVLVFAGWSLGFKELPSAQWPKVLGGALIVAAGVTLMAFSK